MPENPKKDYAESAKPVVESVRGGNVVVAGVIQQLGPGPVISFENPVVAPQKPPHTEVMRRLPRWFARRELLRLRVEETLSRRNSCVLYGPSGFGKTTLAKMIVLEMPVGSWHWIDCRDWPETAEDRDPSPEKLYVLDHAAANQRIFQEEDFACFPGKILVTTTDEVVAVRILARLGQDSCQDAILAVKGLETQEAVEFLTGFVSDRITVDQKRELVAEFCGCPLAIQLIADFVGEWHARGEFPALACCETATDLEKMVTRVVDAWLQKVRNEQLSDQGLLAARALSRLSFVGMSSWALAHILNLAPEEVDRALAPLIDKGLISAYSRLEKTIWIPHDILRNHFRSLPAEEGDHARAKRYVEKVADIVRSGRVDEIGISTCLDAFVVGVRAVFKELHEQEDDIIGSRARFAGLERQWGLLKEIVATTPNERQSERLASLFGERLTTEDCRAVIPVAHCLGNLAPIPSVASTLWLGARSDAKHGDDWAGAACIWGAVNHWKRLGEKEKGLRLLEDRVSEIIRDLSPKKKSVLWLPPSLEEMAEGRSGFGDMSAGAALGGLCVLGRWQRAYELILSAEYALAFPKTMISDLSAVVWLIDERCFQEAWRLMSRCSGRIMEGNAKLLVYEYAEAAGLKLPYTMSPIVLENSFSKWIAAAAHSKGFANYVQRRDPTCLPLLSGT